MTVCVTLLGSVSSCVWGFFCVFFFFLVFLVAGWPGVQTMHRKHSLLFKFPLIVINGDTNRSANS